MNNFFKIIFEKNFILMFVQYNPHKLLRAKPMFTKLGDILVLSACV